MNANDFAYWLNGFVELNKGKMPDEDQWKSIKEHLQLVFTKVTPPVGDRPVLPGSIKPITTPFSPAPYPIDNPHWPYDVLPKITCSTENGEVITLTPGLQGMTYCYTDGLPKTFC